MTGLSRLGRIQCTSFLLLTKLPFQKGKKSLLSYQQLKKVQHQLGFKTLTSFKNRPTLTKPLTGGTSLETATLLSVQCSREVDNYRHHASFMK